MGVKEYAAHRGVARSTVSKAMLEGRIPVVLDAQGRRRIDSEAADAAWNALTEGKHARRTALAAQPPPGTPQAAFLAVVSARERLDAATAELKELEVARMKAELVSAEEVKSRAFVWGQAFREGVMALPDRLAAELAAETDAARVHARMAAECRRLCVDLAQWRPPQEMA